MPPIIDLPPPLFEFELEVTELADKVPGAPLEAGLVSTSVSVSFDGAPATTALYQQRTNEPGPVAVAVAVVRSTRQLILRGSIEQIGGRWYWVSGAQRIPLPNDDPCVIREWPGGHPMSGEDFARFCRTRIIEPPVAPGTVWTVNFSYDLATNEVDGDLSGDASAPGGVVFDQSHDLGLRGSLHLRFAIKALTARSFQRDIRPLFRDSDIEAMRHQGPAIDLTSYAQVKDWAAQIASALTWTHPALSMPCDGKWPPGPLLVFTQWQAQGTPP